MKKALVLFIILMLASAPAEDIPVVTAIDATPATLAFYETEAVQFMLKKQFQSPCRYRVADWSGATVAEGEWAGTQALKLPNLPRGYYTLSLSNCSEPMSFAVLPDASKRKPNPDSFFAVDTAQSWLSGAKSWNVRFPGEQFETISELTRRAGFSVVRDRFGWKRVEPKRGEFDFNVYERNAQMLSERGIKTCTLLDMTPDWAGTQLSKFPSDLIALYETSAKLAENFRGRIFAWEFFNETDGGSKGPAWAMAAGSKAFALALKSVDPELKLLNSSFHVTPLQHYAHTALKSGLGNYIDIFNYHVYTNIAEYPWLISRLRSELAKHGLGDMPVWLTENGTNVEGNATLKTYRPGTLMHSPEQELQVAEFAPKAMLMMQSLGVERDFFFVMTPFWENEGRKDWGLLRMDLTVKPAYVAFATLNAELENARLLGTLSPAENVCAYLYEQPDSTQTLVFWSQSNIDGKGFDGKERKFRLPLPADNYIQRNIFGTPSQVRSSGRMTELTASRYPAYLSGLKGLAATTPAIAPPTAFKHSKNLERTIVLNPVLSKDFEISQSGAFAEMTSVPGKMTLEVYNFSTTPKQGVITLRGGKASGLPEQVTVEPFSKVSIPLEITPDASERGYQTDLIFGGRFAGREITPSTVPLIQTAAILARNEGRELNWRDPARWRHNSSGKMNISFDAQEQALRLQTAFKPGSDRWAYPEYMLDLPAESMAGAIGVTFEIKAGPEIQRGVGFTALMAVLDTIQEQGKAFWLRFPKVSGEWEKRMVIFGGFDPSDVKMLRIGMNPKCDDFTYYIRNVRVINDN